MSKLKLKKKTKKKLIRAPIRDILRARKLLSVPSLPVPQSSQFMPQYLQQKEKNESVQSQIDSAKRAFEEEKARTKALTDQKHQLEEELREAKRSERHEGKVRNQKVRMIRNIEDTKEKIKDLQAENESLVETENIANLGIDLQKVEAQRRELDFKVKKAKAKIDKNVMNSKIDLVKRDNEMLEAELSGLEQSMKSEQFLNSSKDYQAAIEKKLILEERQRVMNKKLETERKNQETQLNIQALNSMNFENATKDEMAKLKAENQKAVLLQKDIDNIRDKEYGLKVAIDERRNAQRRSVEADQQSYIAQEKLKHMMTEKYSDYVLESAKINRKIQQQIEDKDLLEAEAKRLQQIRETQANMEMIKYCNEHNIDIRDIVENFDEHLPNLRRNIKQKVFPEFIKEITNRSAIMNERTRIKNDLHRALTNSPNHESIWQHYCDSVGENNLFNDNDLYLNVTQDVFDSNMDYMKRIIHEASAVQD